MNNAKGENELYQENYLLIDGQYIYIGTNIEYTATTLKVSLTNLNEADAPAVTFEMATSPNTGACPQWQSLTSKPF